METILVTGGNRGIGKEICRQLAAEGHHVLLGARNAEKGAAAAADMNGKVDVVQMDVSNPDTLPGAVAALDRLDVLINNAAIMPGSAGTATVDLAEVRRVLDTNYFGAWQLSQLVLPLLRRSTDGRIINLSSGMGSLKDLEGGGYASYRVSKAAINALSILMATDLKIFE